MEGGLGGGSREKDKKILEEALERIKTMRDTWKEVMRLNNIG